MFHDRRDAGIRLALRLEEYRGLSGVRVLALPRGGVVTGLEIARRLAAPLDVLIVKKLGFPGQPELALGAVSETGTVVLNESLISAYGISDEYIRRVISREGAEIERRRELYRKGGRIAGLEDKIIILADDGVATGATVKAAITTLRKEKIKKLVVALPVAPPEVAFVLKSMSDELVCLETPHDFVSVGSHYASFSQVSDEEVVRALEESASREKAGIS